MDALSKVQTTGEEISTKIEDPSLNGCEAEHEPVSTPEFNPDWRFYLAFTTLAIVALAAALDATSISVALPIIASRLNGTAIEAFWSGTSFLLTATVFQPAFNSISHIFGRKPIFFMALTFFTVGAIVAALANNFTMMLVGRSLQGVGGGGIIALTEVIITDLVPLRERGKWFGFVSGMWAVGSVTGPIVGGVFAQKVSWRWIFWINLPIVGVGYVMVALFLKLNRTRGPSFAAQLRRVDWVGSFLFVASTTSLMIPITWGGVQYSWSHWRTLVPLILGLVGLVVFAPYELYVAQEPMIRFSIFSNWSQRLVFLQTFLHGIILWCLLYYGPIYFEAVKGLSPTLTGVAMFPETFTVAPASVAVGFVVAITGKYRWSLWVGWVVTTLGMGLLYLQDVHTSTVTWIFLNLVPGTGTGVLFSGMALGIASSSAPMDMAHAMAFFSFIRSFGQAVGVAVGGTIFQNVFELKLKAYPLLAPFALEYSKDATGLVQVIKAMEQGLFRDQLIQAYADSLKIVWVTMCGFSAVALGSMCFVKEFNMDVEMATEQGYKKKPKVVDAESSGMERSLEKSKERS